MAFPLYHLRNTVRETPGIYSCAIDSFLELCYHSLYPYFKSLAPFSSYFLNLLFTSCQRYEITVSNATPNMSFIYDLLSWEVRQPVWDYIQTKCPSFQLKDCNAQFSEIFQERVFGNLNQVEKSLFTTSYELEHHCICGKFLKKSFETFVRYVDFPTTNIPLDFFSSWPIYLDNYSEIDLKCDVCLSEHCLNSNVVTSAKFAFIEF